MNGLKLRGLITYIGFLHHILGIHRAPEHAVSDGKEVGTISKDSSGKPFVGPNDFTTDGHGGIYFSASGVYDIKAPISGAVLHL